MAKTPVHFLHIGKTGGTALISTLKEVKETEEYLIRMHPHRVKLMTVPVGHKVVFFLRHPVNRFISSFYSRLLKGAPRHNLEWRPLEAEAFAIFKIANDLAEGLSSTDLSLKEKAENAMRNIFHVRNSFYDWVGDDDYFESRLDDILFIGNQSRMNDDFEKLKSILGVSKEVSLPTDDLASHRNTLEVDKNLSDIGRKNIEDWYSSDILFYSKWENGIYDWES
ncbi:MAG: sulfotransferase family 2 domain-containing protein [Flavobacteriales bacterium]|nr:sulfotransferase family 2 domain-containing protein [Flavobacteriales bacterium]